MTKHVHIDKLLKANILKVFALLSVFSFCLFAWSALAQQNIETQSIRVGQLSIEDGLSQNSVRDILQDGEGYIWIGTDDGLNRYNAYDVTVFRHRSEDSLSIIDNQIKALYEDSNRRIWIGTTSGLSYFDKKIQGFISFYKNGRDSTKYLPSQTINAITEDKEGYIWIGTDKGLSRYDYSTDEFKNYIATEEDSLFLGSNDIRSLLVTEDDELWVGTANGLNIWDKDRNPKRLFRYYPSARSVNTLWGDIINDLMQSRSGEIWIGTNGCLHKYMSDKDSVKRYRRPDGRVSPINSIIEMSEGIWGGTNSYMVSVKDSTISLVTLNADDVGLINTTYRTASNLIWIGSQNAGALRYDPITTQFDYYTAEKDNPNSLPDKNIWAIHKDRDDILWVGTNNGMSRIDRSSGTPSFYNISGGTEPYDLPSNLAYGFLETKEGEFWVASGNSLAILNSFSEKEGARFRVLRADANDTTTVRSTILNLLQGQRGAVWVSTFRGFYKLVPSSDNDFGYVAKNYLSGLPMWGMYEDFSGTLWLGSTEGLIKVIKDENDEPIDYIYYKHDKNDPNSVSHNTIRSIAEDSKGNLWVGTVNGLNMMDRETGKFTRWGERNELATYAVYGVKVDEKDNVWVSTNNGIMKFLSDDTLDDSERFVNYNSKDGLQSNEFNTGAHHKAYDGEMFFGGINGLNAFYPENIKSSMYVPSVVMTDFKIMNRTVELRSASNPDSPLEKDISQTEEMVLGPDAKVITFEFAALEYRRPEKITYAYILEGFDKEWNEVGNRRFATYSNLPQGNYTFKVRATNSAGITKEGVAIKVKVLPPWWKTWWAITLFIATIVGVSFAFYKTRMNAIRRQNDRLELLVEERTSEIAQQNDRLELQKTQIERSYDNIRILSEIGQKITSILDLDAVISAVYEYVNELTDATAFGIGIYNAEKERIEFRGFIEDGARIPDSYDEITDENRLSIVCLTRNEDIIINDFANEHKQYIKEVSTAHVGDSYQSIIYLPLLLEGKIVGVLTVQSRKTNAYSRNDLTILRTLASYISIALDNARTYTQLEGANEVIKSKNQSIMDSIRYGETIQHAILPDPQDFIQSFQDHFIIFKPQAVVSGDFYWSLKSHNKTFIAVVDCTGHGVPGAFMSMIGNTLLNEIVTLQNVIEPAQILDKLNQGIWEALHQEDYQNLDGMDVCLCVIDDADELNMRVVNFAGAKRPLFVFKNDKLIEVKGSRKSIGGRQKGDAQYEQRQLLLDSGDVLYMTTDGYVDQNDADRIKYGTLRFKKVLASIASQPLHDQKEVLLEEMRTHMADQEQRDDITLIGVKL